MVSIGDYSEEGAQTMSLQIMKEILEWKGKVWQPGSGQHTCQQLKQCCSMKSHKTFAPDQAFQAKMQHSSTSNPQEEIYAFGHKVSKAHFADVSLPIMVSLGKIKLGLYSVFIFHVSLETQWFPPAGDWQKALWKACFTTKVWHFKSHRSPVANSNSVLNISEAFPGSPSVSMEPWAQGPGNKDWQVWFRVLLVAGNSLSSGKASEGGLA